MVVFRTQLNCFSRCFIREGAVGPFYDVPGKMWSRGRGSEKINLRKVWGMLQLMKVLNIETTLEGCGEKGEIAALKFENNGSK